MLQRAAAFNSAFYTVFEPKIPAPYIPLRQSLLFLWARFLK